MARPKKAKEPNYSPETVASMTADYKAGKPVEEIAKVLNKSKRSVIAKLVREGVYDASRNATANEPKQDGPTKDVLIETLRHMTGKPLEGIEGAKKAVIQELIDTFQPESKVAEAA